MRLGQTAALLGLVGGALGLDVLPPHARGGRMAELAPGWRKYNDTVSQTHTITLPLDHFDSSNTRTITLRYFTDRQYLSSTGPIFIHMAGESAASGVFASEEERKHGAIAVGYEHRFYGTSLPDDGTGQALENLKYLTVEQNLADAAAIVEAVSKTLPAPKRVGFAFGGSYSGATCAWFRLKYPDVVAGCRSSSGVVNAILDFTEFDSRVNTALQTPDASCAGRLRAATKALERAFAKGDAEKARVKKMFGASNLIGTKMGDSDFFYGVADGPQMMDQYGQKGELCAALAKLPADPTDEQRMQNLADLISTHYGQGFVGGAFYDSEAFKKQLKGMERAWRWQKCTELAYLQAAPAQQSLRSSVYMTMENLLEQCNYVFGTPAPDTASFDKSFYATIPTNASNIVFLNYSDDPWQEASVKAALGPSLPYCMTTCNGCGHCGSGVPSTDTHCDTVASQYVAEWLAAATK